MENSKKIILLLSILCLFDATTYVNPIQPPILFYALTYLCGLILVYLAFSSVEFNDAPTYFKKIFFTYLIYNILIIIIGLTKSESYWDYKNIFITYLPSILICLTIFIGIRFEKNLVIFRFVIERIFPIVIIFGIIFLIFLNETKYFNVVSRLASPLNFFILAFPFLKSGHKVLIIFISIMCIYIDSGWRTNVITIAVCSIFVIMYYLSFLNKKFLNFIAALFLLMPLILIYNGSKNNLDIFQILSMKSSTGNDTLNMGKFDMSGNSRTFLYVEVFDSLRNKNTNLMIGGGAANGYQTIFFQDDKVSKFVNRERYSSEVRFLNTLNKSGIIGVTLELLIIFITAFFAINKSNNDLSKLFGLYLILSWLLYFIEMPLAMNGVYFFYYLIVGLCLNQSFRNSTNKQIKFFFKSL
jgi:hypothetical protein